MHIILEPSIRYPVMHPTAERQCLHECAHTPLLFMLTIPINLLIYRCSYINAWCKAAVSQGLGLQKGSRLLRPSLLQIKTNSGALLFIEVYEAILFPGAQHTH